MKLFTYVKTLGLDLILTRRISTGNWEVTATKTDKGTTRVIQWQDCDDTPQELLGEGRCIMDALQNCINNIQDRILMFPGDITLRVPEELELPEGL